MSAKAAHLQRQIAELSAELLAELSGGEVSPPASERVPAWLSIEGFAARLGIQTS